MSYYLYQKLSCFADLSDSDRAGIDGLLQKPQCYNAGEDVRHQGERPEHVLLMLEGWAYRYKILRDGRKQIVGFLMPGDICDMHVFILKAMDHSIGVLSDAKIVQISPEQILKLCADCPTINRALWWSTLVDESIQREWLTNLGQRDAYNRIAHLFCELGVRMSQIGLRENSRFSLPLTQAELADTVGLTSIHVNRVLQRLRNEGHILLKDKQLTIYNFDELARVCDFTANYLHLERRQVPVSQRMTIHS